MKTVLYSVPLGYFARNLLRTGVIDKLLKREDLRIVLLTPAYKDEDFIKEFSFSDRILFERLFQADDLSNIWERVLWKLLYISGLQWRNRLMFFPLTELSQFYYRNFKPRFYDRIFSEYRPDLVITASPGNTSPLDAPVIREAQRWGIKILCLVHSWDNIAGMKGIMPTRPDEMGVWNELQKQEAIDLHFYNPEKIHIVGPPHFDIYQDDSIFLSREDFCSQLNLNPERKIVTVVIASTSATENTYILDILLEAFKRQAFVAPVQLLCRLHPRISPEENRKTYKKYIDDPHICVDIPHSYSKTIKWNPDRSEMVHLANTIKHTDIVVNIASTVTIEAAILDKPVVNLAFSLSEPEKFRQFIINNSWKYHFSYVIERRCSYFAKSPEDLIGYVNEYLLHPKIHREGRKRLAEDLCYKLDGKATDRTADLICNLVLN